MKEETKESIKLILLRKIGLTTISHTTELLLYKGRKAQKEVDTIRNEYYERQLKDDKEHKKEIKNLNDLHLKAVKILENKINELKTELKEMHDKYDGKYIVEKLPPVKLKTKQVMRVSNRNGVRSRIARNAVKDLEKE